MSHNLQGLTFLVKPFGCQMNFHDAERVVGLLESCGCLEVAEIADADIVVFLTCAVREGANTRLYGQVSTTVSAPLPPSGKRTVAVGGCIAQEYGKDLREHIKNVDVVFGTDSIASLPRLIAEQREASDKPLLIDVHTAQEEDLFSSDLPTQRADTYHAWVPIMTGCNNFCSYCIVPYVRGRERSRTLESIVAECQSLVDDGVREITLLGQNVNSYGKNIYGSPKFADCLHAVAQTGIERIRFTSSNPHDFLDETIEAMAEIPAVMPHLHLAVQSGSSRILKAMNRKYTREGYLNLVRKLKCAMPDLALSTDIIVGFPGEEEQDFAETLSLVSEVGFSSAFTFIYSPRPGTVAARLEQNATPETIQERFNRLTALVEECALNANMKDLHTVVSVLVENTSKRDASIMVGHSEKYQTVHFPLPAGYSAEKLIGKIVDVDVDIARTWYLKGSMTGTAR